jgi:hypothetical protein
MRLTRTNVPVRLRADFPLLQIQPLPREVYDDRLQARMAVLPDLESFSADDWEDYRQTIVVPNADPDRPFGKYAVESRKRRKAGCPYAEQHAAAAV